MQNVFDNFDGRKIASLVESWRPIKDGIIPPPISNSLDLSSFCPNNCYFCNSRSRNNYVHMDDETFNEVINVYKKYKIRSACISGGGESLANPRCEEYFEEIIKADTQIGIITNGVFYRKIPKECRFINVSINSYDKKSYSVMSGTDGSNFDIVCDNIKHWVNDGHIVTYKVLISNFNKDSSVLLKSVQVANDLNVNNVLFRFAMLPWNEVGKKQEHTELSEVEADIMVSQIKIIEKYYPHIKIHMPLERYDKQAHKHIPIRCVGGMINFVILSNGDVMLCSDLRFDIRMRLCHISEFQKYWGGEKHIEMIKSVDCTKCPRCSFLIHDRIIDQFIFNDVSNQYFL